MKLSPVFALIACLAASAPTLAAQSPKIRTGGFGLLTRIAVPSANRVYCPVGSSGIICADVADNPASGLWPRNTPDSYVFTSGLEFGGIIGQDGGAWAGDTSGAFFFDPRGIGQTAEGIAGAALSSDSSRGLGWPPEARVPGGTEGAQYQLSAQGQVAVSEEDAWWVTWEGSSISAGGPHPLGVVVEGRALQWTYPVGNEDILYFVFNFYNISATDPGAYTSVRPAIRPLLLRYAEKFHGLQLTGGTDLPSTGYTISPFRASLAADMDVADPGSNYASAQLPFGLAYSYESRFQAPAGWTFDPTIFSPPFVPRAGLVGTKLLRDLTGGRQMQLFSASSTSGPFPARDVFQLYRLLANYPPAVPIMGGGNGFVMYILGDIFTFELTGAVPSRGSVWTLRKYVGAITGGHGASGNEGSYAYSNPEGVLPFTAIGASVQAQVTVSKQLLAPVSRDLRHVHTVPDPFYLTSGASDAESVRFVNLPDRAIIRIYSSSGVLVGLLEHESATFGGEESWNLRNRSGQGVASGVYFYHIESGDARRVGRFTVVREAP
jgi:hypothetical protein